MGLSTSIKERVAAELEAIYKRNGALEPVAVVDWAAKHRESALHSRFEWDNGKAGHAYRLWQAREMIVEVEAIYPDGKVRQVYVSPVECRKKGGGYMALVEVLSDTERKQRFVEQALADYRRVGEKYEDLKELAGVRRAVDRATAVARRKTMKVSDTARTAHAKRALAAKEARRRIRA